MAAYDVFISYRRDGGGAEARLIQSALQSRRVRAFLDVTELGRGYFDDALLKSIEQTPNFIVILSPHSLDRAESDEDWLRKEVAHALKSERNVVPLIMPGFQFPPKLPRDLKNLPRHQGMDYSHLYFDAMIQKLLSTLDLSGSDEERAQQEREARQREERERAERLRREAGLFRWSDRFRLGDAAASAEARQAAVVAFWSLLLVSFAWLATASGNEAQGGFTAGAVFLALAVWVRASPRQAATTGLVISALTTIGMVGAALSQRFDLGRISFALYAAGATAALWLVSRATRLPVVLAPATSPPGADTPLQPGRAPFGARLGDFIGVGPNRDDRRLRWFIGARFLAGVAFWWAVPDYQRMIAGFHVNLLWVAWVSAALPLALAFTYRTLRNPLLAIGASAVIASIADPAFYQTGMAALSVAGNLLGSFLLAAVLDEVERKPVATWLGCAAANLGGAALWQLWGLRFGGWSQAGPVLYRFTLLCIVFTAVFVAGIFATPRKT
jgi:hypothetical protein